VICDFGDVVVVPFPFVDHPVRKRRPAVVLSSRNFNDDHGQSVLLMITTGTGSSWPSDIEIDDLTGTGLAHPSVVRWKAFTVPNDVIVRQIGALGPSSQSRLSRSARKVIAP
jgi:mRNA interferase MazF